MSVRSRRHLIVRDVNHGSSVAWVVEGVDLDWMYIALPS